MKPFHLLVNIEAENKNAIREQLVKLIAEIDDAYGKPRQGIISGFNYEISVTTKLWDNREY
jgi:hypothetical protein